MKSFFALAAIMGLVLVPWACGGNNPSSPSSPSAPTATPTATATFVCTAIAGKTTTTGTGPVVACGSAVSLGQGSGRLIYYNATPASGYDYSFFQVGMITGGTCTIDLDCFDSAANPNGFNLEYAPACGGPWTGPALGTSPTISYSFLGVVNNPYYIRVFSNVPAPYHLRINTP